MYRILKQLLLCVVIFVFVPISYGQCDTGLTLIEPIEHGVAEVVSQYQQCGIYMPSITENGQFVRVLVLYVEFKDDQWDIDFSDWPKNHAPEGWMNTNFIDQTVNQNSTNGNITDYFTTMSLGKYKIIGNFYHHVTSKTRDEYITLGMSRGAINREILHEMDSTGFDFTPYDNWSKNASYDFNWGPDGEIDMIWMIYRNISLDKPNSFEYAAQLGFGDSYWGIFSGESSLGGGGILNINGNMTIDLNGLGLVSGINIMGVKNGLWWVKSIAIHEFGHHLLGPFYEAHMQRGSWGIMSGYGLRGQVVNSYERQKLGWIISKQYDYNTSDPIILEDFVTTGDALLIKIPGTSKCYHIENHQRLSPLDDIDLTPDGKGIYVLYQEGDYNIDNYFYSAEGKAIWTFDHFGVHPNGAQVPVFRRGSQDNINGRFDTEAIPYFNPITQEQKWSVIEGFVNFDGVDTFQPLFKGDGKDMMRPEYIEVFSPWSNPSLESVAFQVISEDDKIKIIQKVETGTQIELPPAKPQNLNEDSNSNYFPTIKWDANIEPDMVGGTYKIYRTGGDSISPLNYYLVATINAPLQADSFVVWQDPGVKLGRPGDEKLYYKVKAVDNKGKESVFSEICWIYYEEILTGTVPAQFSLYQNYPNPFNASTTIRYEIPERGFVTLIVYDILGNEIATLVNEEKPAGNYEVEFKTSSGIGNLVSGIYFYQLKSGNYVETRKMILLK